MRSVRVGIVLAVLALTAAGPDGLQVRFDWLRIAVASDAEADQSRERKR